MYFNLFISSQRRLSFYRHHFSTVVQTKDVKTNCRTSDAGFGVLKPNFLLEEVIRLSKPHVGRQMHGSGALASLVVSDDGNLDSCEFVSSNSVEGVKEQQIQE